MSSYPIWILQINTQHTYYWHILIFVSKIITYLASKGLHKIYLGYISDADLVNMVSRVSLMSNNHRFSKRVVQLLE